MSLPTRSPESPPPFMGLPETDQIRGMAMTALGNGLSHAKQYKDASSVYEAELSMMRRNGAAEYNLLAVQANLANTYKMEGRFEHSLKIYRDVQSGVVRLHGEEHEMALVAAINCATSLDALQRFDEVKSLMRKKMPVARRVLGAEHDYMLRMKDIYARVLYKDPGATLDELREAVTTLEDTTRIARRVLGLANPVTGWIGESLRKARAALHARETPPGNA